MCVSEHLLAFTFNVCAFLIRYKFLLLFITSIIGLKYAIYTVSVVLLNRITMHLHDSLSFYLYLKQICKANLCIVCTFIHLFQCIHLSSKVNAYLSIVIRTLRLQAEWVTIETKSKTKRVQSVVLKTMTTTTTASEENLSKRIPAYVVYSYTLTKLHFFSNSNRMFEWNYVLDSRVCKIQDTHFWSYCVNKFTICTCNTFT